MMNFPKKIGFGKNWTPVLTPKRNSIDKSPKIILHLGILHPKKNPTANTAFGTTSRYPHGHSRYEDQIDLVQSPCDDQVNMVPREEFTLNWVVKLSRIKKDDLMQPICAKISQKLLWYLTCRVGPCCILM